MKTQSYQKRKQTKLKGTKTYVVVGSGRSGTSFLADCLQRNGVFMGQGGGFAVNMENQDFVHLNKHILQAAGGAWNNPPPREEILKLAARFAPKIQDAIKDNKQSLWGFKDPRTTYTLELYLPHLPGDVYLFATFRDVHRTARSMVLTEDLSYSHARYLVTEANRRLIELVKEYYQ